MSLRIMVPEPRLFWAPLRAVSGCSPVVCCVYVFWSRRRLIEVGARNVAGCKVVLPGFRS